MFRRTFPQLLPNLQPKSLRSLSPLPSYFCSTSNWRPKVPKYQILVDKSSYRMAHAIWDVKSAENVEKTHHVPKGIRDHIAYYISRILRVCFDFFSGFRYGKVDEHKYLTRIIFLETIAGVPPMIAGMVRHTRSLSKFRHDGGWIHHLMEEAENERMHLFTFLDLRNPGFLFRVTILGGQAVFIMAYTTLYLISSRLAHRLVGYIEEEAVSTYSHCIKSLDDGELPLWKDMKAPDFAIEYWNLNKEATMKDVLLVVRADEALHREMNHRFADVGPNASMDHLEVKVVDSSEKRDNEKEKP